MKNFLLIILLVNSLFAVNDDELLAFRESVADYYYRFLDNSTSFLYKKNRSNYEYIKKHNKLRVYLDNYVDSTGKFNSSLAIKANIKLPKISNNLYFTIDKDNTNKIENELKSQLEEEKQSSRVGLKYYFLKEEDQSIYAKLGGRLNFKESKIYLKLGTDKLNRYEDIESFIYFNEYYYIKDSLLKTEVGFDFKKKLNKKFYFSQLNNITLDDSQTYIRNTLLLDQDLNEISMLSYWSTIYSIYHHNNFKKDSVSFNVKYHQYIKKWIFMDIIPSVIKSLNKEKETKKYIHLNFGFIF